MKLETVVRKLKIKTIIKVLFIPIVIIFTACSSNDSDENEKGLNVIVDTLSYMDYLFDSYDIQLKVPDSVLLGQYAASIMTDKELNLYLWNMEEIYKFDKNGNYVTRFNKIGPGPSEVKMIFRFCFDEKLNLYIYDPMKFKIMIYDEDFNYINSIKNKSVRVFDCLAARNGKLYCYISESKRQNSILIVYDTEKLKQISKTEMDYNLELRSMWAEGSMNLFNNKVYLNNSLDNKIIAVDLESKEKETIRLDQSKFVTISKDHKNPMRNRSTYSRNNYFYKLSNMFLMVQDHPYKIDSKVNTHRAFALFNLKGDLLKDELFFKEEKIRDFYRWGESKFIGSIQEERDERNIPRLRVLTFK